MWHETCKGEGIKMHPLDLSPKANMSLFKGTSVSITNNSFLHTKSNKTRSSFCAFSNNNNNSTRDKDPGKRGRPRADILTALMVEGSSSRSRIRCNKCGRVFPREKSLQAHMRTHTGERPYSCDFPGCSKAFCQSGQLKTHQRLHTGEKPFVCNVEGCLSRFTHANRHCNAHPHAGLKRTEVDLVHVTQQLDQEPIKSPEKEWLERYINKCKDRLTTKDTLISKTSSDPIDLRKRTDDSQSSPKRSDFSSVSARPTQGIAATPSPSAEDKRNHFVTYSTPLPSIPSFPMSSVLTSYPYTPPPLSPFQKYHTSVTLTPITPRHPGTESRNLPEAPPSSPSSPSSASSSSSSTSSAIRNLSTFNKPTPPKPVPYRYLTKTAPGQVSTLKPYSSSSDLSTLEESPATQSLPPFHGAILPSPSSTPLTLASLQTQHRLENNFLPYRGEKDSRYLSALALIELSKG